MLSELVGNGGLSEIAKAAGDAGVAITMEFGRVTAYVDEFDNDGRYALSLDDLALYLKSPSQYFAAQHGVSVEQYEAWREAALNPTRCIALTSKGTPCQSTVYPKEYALQGPKEFDPAAPVYCHVHANQTMNIKGPKG